MRNGVVFSLLLIVYLELFLFLLDKCQVLRYFKRVYRWNIDCTVISALSTIPALKLLWLALRHPHLVVESLNRILDPLHLVDIGADVLADRHDHHKIRALARRRSANNLAAKMSHNLPGDVEAEADSLDVYLLGGIYEAKQLEQIVLVFRLDTDARIFHLNFKKLLLE